MRDYEAGSAYVDRMMSRLWTLETQEKHREKKRHVNVPVLCRIVRQHLSWCLLRCLRRCSGTGPPHRPLGQTGHRRVGFLRCASSAGAGAEGDRRRRRPRWSRPCVQWEWRTSGWVWVAWARCQRRLLEARATCRHRPCQTSWKRRVDVGCLASGRLWGLCLWSRRRSGERSRRAWLLASQPARAGRWWVCALRVGMRVESVQTCLQSWRMGGARATGVRAVTGCAIATATATATVTATAPAPALWVLLLARLAEGASVENVRLIRCP